MIHFLSSLKGPLNGHPVVIADKPVVKVLEFLDFEIVFIRS